MAELPLKLRDLLGYRRKNTIHFSDFVNNLVEDPQTHLHTSSSIISAAIKYFGHEIVIRSGEPVISYNVFKDPFSNGINAVFGQEYCIKQVLDIIESADKEVGPNRGIILVGPPASGKTNVVDLIIRALEEYTKQISVRLYTFFFRFENEDGSRSVEVHSSFHHNPLLLFPTLMQKADGNLSRPRQELFDHINQQQGERTLLIPSFYQNANLDKKTLDILEELLSNPKNEGMSLFEILEKYVRVEEIEFSGAQAHGISNIDDMQHLRVRVNPQDLSAEDMGIVNEHLPGKSLRYYEGSIIGSNRGILHIHDAFGVSGERIRESDYKPLLMLLGSGRVSVESTQTAVDSTVILTTNIEEMELLDHQLTSSKLLDRIEKVPVNYLLDASSETDILRRDLANMREKYDVDPNLLRIASYYSVMTRLLPPMRKKFPSSWSQRKIELYLNITPEQKLFIYSAYAEDPVNTIKKLPHWHPFRNEAMRLGLNLNDEHSFRDQISHHPESVNLRDSGLFSEEDLRLIDDEFMRDLWKEHYPNEGRNGISIRQLQNVMRNTMASSDGLKVHVGIFLSQLNRIITEGPDLHHWLEIDTRYTRKRKPISDRSVGRYDLHEGEGDYGDFQGLVGVVRAIYFHIIRKEITVCTVDRDPRQIEADLRRYLQYALLARAQRNRAFAHVMVPRFTFIDPNSGMKVDEPDYNYMKSMERVLEPEMDEELFRQMIAQKFLDLQSSGELVLEGNRTIINSRNDNLLNCFAQEYSRALSHRKIEEEINPEVLHNAFFHKLNDLNHYKSIDLGVQKLVETIITNMHQRFGYSRSIALTTIVYALRKDIVNFKEILS